MPLNNIMKFHADLDLANDKRQIRYIGNPAKNEQSKRWDIRTSCNILPYTSNFQNTSEIAESCAVIGRVASMVCGIVFT